MRLSTDEVATAFRMRVASTSTTRRENCPSSEEIGATFLPETPEEARLRVIDHVSSCLSCARDFAAARLLYSGHERIVPMLPDRLDREELRPSNVVRFPTGRQVPVWRTISRPSFALAAAASLAVVFVAAAIVAYYVGIGNSSLVAIAPAGRATSARLELAWRPLTAAESYDVTMSWPTGKVFYESGPVTSTRIEVPASAVAQMKRGQTCLWTLRALDADGRELARETFSFLVDFDPAAG